MLFADVRGFTTFSEQLEPERLMEIINKYMSVASDAINLFEGVVDKYMGDAVTGLFNTPLNPQADHALRGYLRHLEVQARVSHGTDGGRERWTRVSRHTAFTNLDTFVSRLVACRPVRIDEIIAAKDEPVFSFEFFPPKTDEGERNLRATLESLAELEPDFASVTYGAGGSTRNRTVEVTKWLKREVGVEAMAHLSCVGATREELQAILGGIADAGIDNVLALRGDPPRGEETWKPHPGGLRYSTELVSMIRSGYQFSVGAACFPEIHPEAPDLTHDLRFLKEKVDSGVSFLITQLFFDNELYFGFVEEARGFGIDVPILPG